MPGRPPSFQEIERFLRSQREVDPRSLDLQSQQRGSPEVMPNPEYWPDGSTTHIFPPEDNPMRRNGVQQVAERHTGGIWGDGQRGGIFGAKVDQPRMLLRPFDATQDQPRSNPDGSYSTEITRTVQTPEGWAIVPSLWFGGEDGPRDFGGMSDDQLSALALQYERMSKQKFPRFKSLEEAEKSAILRSKAGGATQAPLAKEPRK